MLFLLATYLLIQIMSCAVLLTFVVLEGHILPPEWAKYLPAPKAEGLPYLNIAPALRIRQAARAREAAHLFNDFPRTKPADYEAG
jgi:hypothetical protein